MVKDFFKPVACFIAAISIAAMAACGGSSSTTSATTDDTATTTTVTSSKISGSMAVSNNSALSSSGSSKVKSYKVGSTTGAPRQAVSSTCSDYRIYLIPTSTGAKGDIYFTISSNTSTGSCNISGDLPDPGIYDAKLYSESVADSGTFDIEEAIIELGLTITEDTDLEAQLNFDETLKIVSAELSTVDSDGNKSETTKSGNLDIPAIQDFPDISGAYTVKMKRTQMDNFQKGEDDAITGNNDGGWEESYYVSVYTGNMKNKQTYKEIANTPSKRMAVWMDKGKRDSCYAANSNSDAISIYSMQASANAAANDVLTINSATTSNDIYTFLVDHTWLPDALIQDAENTSAGSAKQELQNLDCGALMPLLKPFYAAATVDADSGYCTALITPAQGVLLPEVQTYLGTLSAQAASGTSTMLADMLFATNEGPPHAEWCKKYQLANGNTTKMAEFTNFMVGMCQMHTKGDDSLFVKRDLVRQFFDIFAEIKREPRSDKKMDALADFIKDNDITSSNFATRMGDDTLLTNFLNIMAGMPCFDDGCKSWKRALKRAAGNIAGFKTSTFCDNVDYSSGEEFCFTFAEFTATSTTIDLKITDDGTTTPQLELRTRLTTKTNGVWNWGNPTAPTNATVSSNVFTMFDPTGAQKQVTEANYTFDYGGNTYNLGVDGSNDSQVYGDMFATAPQNPQYLGVFGNKVSKEEPAQGTTVTVYRIKSGGGMAEQISEMACSGGYHPVEIKTAGATVSALMGITLPPFDFAGQDENTFNQNLTSESVGTWYQILYNMYIGSGELAEGCGKEQLKHSIQGIYWALQAPGVPAIVADPDEPTATEIADVVLILNSLSGSTPPGGLNVNLTQNGAWTQIQSNLVQQRQLMNIYWNIQSIQQEVGYSQMKQLLATADMDPTVDVNGNNPVDDLESLDATQLATFLQAFAALDIQGHWSWIWGNEQMAAQPDSCFRPDLVHVNGECPVWTATTLAATGDHGETNLEDIKHRLRDARRKFALEEDGTFRTNITNIIANSQCIPDITFKDEPEIAQNGSIKFLLNLRGPAFRLLDDAINFRKNDSGTIKYSVSDVSMEIHQEDMSNTCVFGEKKEISNMPLPARNTNGNYEFTGLFMRAFFDGCGESDNLQNSEESSNTEQSGTNTGSSTVGSERFREVQSFKATQD